MSQTKERQDRTVPIPINRDLKKTHKRDKHLMKFEKNIPKKTNYRHSTKTRLASKENENIIAKRIKIRHK